MENNKDKQELENGLNEFLGKDQNQECTTDECRIKQDKSLLERINKKIITEDGRQLLL